MVDLILVGAIAISIYTDLRSRRIYNWVVVPAAIGGLALNSWNAGLTGLGQSLSGLALGTGLLLIPFLLGGIGAGDVKLLGAVGALKGIGFVCTAFAVTALAGGVISLLAAVKHCTLKTTIPYGPAIGVGTLVTLLITHLSR